MDSTDEIIGKNSNSASGFIYFGAIYEYYTLDKSSLSRTVGYSYMNYDNDLHGLRPLFLFKEWYYSDEILQMRNKFIT